MFGSGTCGCAAASADRGEGNAPRGRRFVTSTFSAITPSSSFFGCRVLTCYRSRDGESRWPIEVPVSKEGPANRSEVGMERPSSRVERCSATRPGKLCETQSRGITNPLGVEHMSRCPECTLSCGHCQYRKCFSCKFGKLQLKKTQSIRPLDRAKRIEGDMNICSSGNPSFISLDRSPRGSPAMSPAAASAT
jgi:hypothetical protein